MKKPGMLGKMLASTTRRPLVPRTRKSPAFHAQLSRRRRSACGARSGYLLRNGAAMGFKVWALFARELRRRRPRPTSRWHLDEMAVTIAGQQFWLWRAVDDEGEVLDLLVQRRRDKAEIG